VDSGRLLVRRDRMIHADLGAKQKILDMLLSYNPLWLRVGLEVTCQDQVFYSLRPLFQVSVSWILILIRRHGIAKGRHIIRTVFVNIYHTFYKLCKNRSYYFCFAIMRIAILKCCLCRVF